MTKDETRSSGTTVRSYLSDGQCYVDVNSDQKVYLGARNDKGQFDFVVTMSGPCKNVKGLLGETAASLEGTQDDMPLLPWRCAHGDAPQVAMECADVLALAAARTNIVSVGGRGTVSSLGACEHAITKHIHFRPAGGAIELEHSPTLQLLGGADRTIAGEAHGTYRCDGSGTWREVYFTGTGAASAELRIAALERRVAELEQRLRAYL